MSSIFKRNSPPKVFLDTTVLCGALRKDGINRKILRAAQFPHFYRPIIQKYVYLNLSEMLQTDLEKAIVC